MNQPKQPQHEVPLWLSTATLAASIGCVSLLAWWAFSTPVPNTDIVRGFAPRPLVPCVMDADGYLRGQLYGQIQTELNWRGDEMRCDGMYRPDSRGIRLVFDEHLDEELPGLLIVIGIKDAVLGEPVVELPANITIIDQANGQFFSTRDQPRCWTTFSEQLELTGTTEEIWRINGQIYCANALAALAGPGAVTLGDIEFSGLFKPGMDQL